MYFLLSLNNKSCALNESMYQQTLGIMGDFTSLPVYTDCMNSINPTGGDQEPREKCTGAFNQPGPGFPMVMEFRRTSVVTMHHKNNGRRHHTSFPKHHAVYVSQSET